MDPLELIFFTCDKHLLSGVTLKLSYRRSHEDFLIILEDAAKHYKLQILEANLYVRKMTVTDHVLSCPLNQLCSKLLRTTHIKKKLQKHFLQQLVSAAGNRKIFLLVNR